LRRKKKSNKIEECQKKTEVEIEIKTENYEDSPSWRFDNWGFWRKIETARRFTSLIFGLFGGFSVGTRKSI
jgi:hypothetical protein